MDHKSCSIHINCILGAMIKNWETTNPEALKAIDKVNKENHEFLFMPAELKLKYIRDMKAANFKDSKGNKIDLLTIEREASSQKPPFVKKHPDLRKPVVKKAYQTSFDVVTDAMPTNKPSRARVRPKPSQFLGDVNV
jgi:hypothetical protein